MDIELLGPLRIRDAGADIPVGGPLQRRLLARLGIAAGRIVSFDELEAAVWGDEPPPTSRHTLAAYVSRLRRAGLDIATTTTGYSLLEPTDVAALDRLVAEARQILPADPRRGVELLRQALALWRGGLTPDLEGDAVGLIEAARLEELVAGLREDLLAVELDLGSDGEAVATARRLASDQPYRERGWELLMLALYRSGRQAEALDVYAECRRRLVDDLGIEPGSGLRRMQQAVLAQDPLLDPPAGRDAAAVPRKSRLPGAATRLVGRLAEQDALADAWARARAVTLVGPPGAGKTRLAVATARAAEPPVWYVSVEQVAPEQSIAGAILDVVAPSSMATNLRQGLVQALAEATGLLVLDGCEQRLADVGAEVDVVVAACPGVRVLTTSRERLGLLDEALVPVGPLAEDEARDLLVDRARLVDPRFELAPDQLDEADRLCRLVDRLPLGLELVARHLQLLRLDELVERVEADLARWAGGPARGRTGLWAALDASTARLPSLERRILLVLAVMVADADAALIGAVLDPAAAEAEVFEAIAHLVDASLLQVRSADGPTRYELLRTIRIHTLETADRELVEAARRGYDEAILDRVASLAGRLGSAERTATLPRLDREMPHLRAVLARAVAAIPSAISTDALELVVGLTDYWLGRHPAEGLDWLVRLREAAGPASALRAQAALSGAHLAYWQTDFSAGRAMAEEARAGYAALGDALGEGRALRRLGAMAAATDDFATARRAHEASLERLEAAGSEREIGTTLLHLGSLLADQGLSDAARSLLARALTIAVASGDPLARGHALAALNLADWKGGELTAALREGEEALAIFRQLHHRPTEGTTAYRLAAISRGLGRPAVARRYARQAIAAGELASTRTTVAFGHINLARLDLDEGATESAAAHLVEALEAIDPVADRWVLVDALEGVARLAVATGADGAAHLLSAAAAIRLVIHHPVAPTEVPEVAATRRQAGPIRPTSSVSTPVGVAAVVAEALAVARGQARPGTAPAALRRARA